MDTRSALAFAAYYHVVALVASLLGIAIAVVGLAYGLDGALGAISPLDPTTYLSGVSPAGAGIATAAVVAGLLVRRIGRTAVRLKVQTEAVENNLEIPSSGAIGRRVGDDVAAEVLEVVETVVDVDEIRPADDEPVSDETDDDAVSPVTVESSGDVRADDGLAGDDEAAGSGPESNETDGPKPNDGRTIDREVTDGGDGEEAFVAASPQPSEPAPSEISPSDLVGDAGSTSESDSTDDSDLTRRDDV